MLRVINFAHGAFYIFGAYIIYSLAESYELGFWTGMVGVAAGLAVMAIVIARGLFRFIYDKEHLMQLLFTFAVVLILTDLAKMIWGTDQYSVSYPDGFGGAINIGVTFYPTYRLLLIVVGPVILVGLTLFTTRTRWGRFTRAATQDREMLGAFGVSVPMIYTGVFILGSALAGMGDALAAPLNSPTPGMDVTLIVDCFVIVIVGGLGSIVGSFVGALIYGIVFNFGSVIVPNWQEVFPFLILLSVLLWRPWGLFGRPEGEGARGSAGGWSRSESCRVRSRARWCCSRYSRYRSSIRATSSISSPRS